MPFSVRDVARILNVSESVVRSHIDCGRLDAEKRNGEFWVPEAALQKFLQAEKNVPDSDLCSDGAPVAPTVCHQIVVEPILEHLSHLGRQIREEWDVLRENRQLGYEMRQKEFLLAQKDMEIESLQRALEHQKELWEKEAEAQERILQEKWAVMEREAEKRIALERDETAKRLALEKDAWSARLREEKERCAQKLLHAQQQEGFWTKILKMLTWS